MKIILMLIATVIFAGCEKKQAPAIQGVPAAPTSQAQTEAIPTAPMDAMPMPIESAAATQLKKEAIVRHLHFSIVCNEDPDSQPFSGEAWEAQGDETFNPTFIEDGGVPSWIATGNTQDAVARQLYKLVRTSEHNFMPKHKRNAMNHRQCPQPIRG